MTKIRTEDPAFVRDGRSKAILNIDTEAAEMYRAERNRQLEQAQMKSQLAEVKQDMQDLKDMLGQLLKAVDGSK